MDLATRVAKSADDDIMAALVRTLVRKMAFDPTYSMVAGSADDLRAVLTAAAPGLDTEALCARSARAAVQRALMTDLVRLPALDELTHGCFDRNRGTMLAEVTPSIPMAAVVLALWDALSCSYANAARREGLAVELPAPIDLGARLPSLSGALG